MFVNENVGFKIEYYVRVNFEFNVYKDVLILGINSKIVCLK